MDIKSLDEKEKCRLAIETAEKASLIFESEMVNDLIKKAIELAREWMNEGIDVSEALYIMLDNEEDGFTILQEMEENESRVNAWNCIIDAIAYISRKSYEKKGANYFPEPIELVDDSILNHMIESSRTNKGS